MHQEIINATADAFPSFSLEGARIEPLNDIGGSGRRYLRIHPNSGKSIILMEYTDARPDNLKFISAGRILSKIGNKIPEILHLSLIHI